MIQGLRARLSNTGIAIVDRVLGELARDVDNVLSQLLLALPNVVTFTENYTEPMYVGYDHEPKGIFCLRVRADAALETPVLCGAAMHFVWEVDQKRLRVTSIDGLSAATPPVKYRFTFLMVG